MTRRDISAGVEFRQGFATTALEDGATTGQVPALAADGQMEFASAGGGSQSYVPGTDMICVTIQAVPYGGLGQQIDWSLGTPFVTQIGTAITAVGPDIVMGEDGCYDVQVHLTQVPQKIIADVVTVISTKLSLGAGIRSVDGDDAYAPGGSDPNNLVRCNASYRWDHAAGDTVGATLYSPGADETYTFNAVCQVVRLSDIALPVGA